MGGWVEGGPAGGAAAGPAAVADRPQLGQNVASFGSSEAQCGQVPTATGPRRVWRTSYHSPGAFWGPPIALHSNDL